jgi:hypothetical protein
MEIQETRTLDVFAPHIVQLEISKDGRRVDVYADGVTLVNTHNVGEVVITDHRQEEEGPHKEW